MNTTAYRCKIVCIVLLFTILQVSCKKEIVNPNPRTPQPSEPRSSAELVKDGVYLYYKRYSLWADLSIPSYDPISQFTDKFNDPYSLLEALKSLTPAYVGDKYNGHIDRFSYMYDIESSGSERASLKMDTNYGFGMQFSWGVVDGEPAYPILDMVEGGSPAALAGLKRSDIILEINEEKDFSVPVTCTGTNCAPLNKSRFDQLNAFLRSAINSPSAMRIKYKTQEGVVAEKHLNYSYVYDIDPVLKTKVITSAGKGVGYFAFSSFEDIPEGGVNRQKIDDAFALFAEKGVQDIIIDLRYNGGGYVNTAVYLANKLISEAGNGQLMMRYELNKYLAAKEQYPGGQFGDEYFERSNTLKLNKIRFIVSEQTASASELLINVLKPYYPDLKLIASGLRTYGKPVGFFEQRVENKLSLWVTSFKMYNKNGESDYWDGLPAQITGIQDYIFADFGDTNELMLQAALKDINPAALWATTTKVRKFKNAVNMGAINKLTKREMFKKNR